LPDSPMLGSKGLNIMKHGNPNLARRAKLVFCCSVFRNLVRQVGSASIRGARFDFGPAGIGRFYEQPLSTYAVGEAWALRAISYAFTALLVCPIRRSWVPPPFPPEKNERKPLDERKVALHFDPRPRSGSYFSVCHAEVPGSILGRGVIL